MDTYIHILHVQALEESALELQQKEQEYLAEIEALKHDMEAACIHTCIYTYTYTYVHILHIQALEESLLELQQKEQEYLAEIEALKHGMNEQVKAFAGERADLIQKLADEASIHTYMCVCV